MQLRIVTAGTAIRGAVPADVRRPVRDRLVIVGTTAQAADYQVGEEEITGAEVAVVVRIGVVASQLVLFVLFDDGKELVVHGIVDPVVGVQVFPALQGEAVAVLAGADENEAVAFVNFIDPVFEFGGAA